MFKTNDIEDQIFELLSRMGRARTIDLHVASGRSVRQVQKTLKDLQAAGKVISYPYSRKERIYSIRAGNKNILSPTQHIEHHSLSVQVAHALSSARNGGDVIYENELRRTPRLEKVPDALIKFKDSKVWLEIENGRKDRSKLYEVAMAAIDWCTGMEEKIFVIAYPYPDLDHELRIIESFNQASEGRVAGWLSGADYIFPRIVLARIEFAAGRHLVVDSLSCRRLCMVDRRVALVDFVAEDTERFKVLQMKDDQYYLDTVQIQDLLTSRIAIVGFYHLEMDWAGWLDDTTSGCQLPVWWSGLPRHRRDDVVQEVIGQLTRTFAGKIKAFV